MGQRSSTETPAAILKAFLDQSTWKQADLAREVDVGTAGLRKCLNELRSNGVPLTDEFEHPHVYWSVPKTWYPGGILFTNDQITEILRQLSRLPKSKARNLLIESLLKYLPSRSATAAIVPGETTEREEEHLPVIEDSANQNVALKFRYFTATRGKETMRHASVHRVLVGPPARFVATCHRTGTLKWFRVESVTHAKLDKDEAFRGADSKLVDAHLRASLDGLHEGGAPTKHVFFVSDPDSRWVARNLLEEMQSEDVDNGIHVTLETSALKRLARYVVGLGGAAKPLTPALEEAVAALAKASLDAIASK